MPIYAYRCESCGHAQDVLQKISDAPLSDCPACGAATFRKQVTAAGFQLKGSGWYVTDFRGGSGAAAKDAKKDGGGDGGADAGKAPAETPASAPAAGGGTAEAAKAPAASAPAPAPAPASGGSSTAAG
jgi:putative FmdB family regulatory protein